MSVSGMKIKDIVKNNVARFSFYRAGNCFYEVEVEGMKYKFPVSLEDLGIGYASCGTQGDYVDALHP